MVKVRSEEEFNQVKERAPFMVTMYGSSKCGGCNNIKPHVSKRACNLQEFIPVVYCDIEHDWCRKQVGDYGSEHIPLIVGTENGSFEEPAFMIKGASKDKERELHENFDILDQMVSQAKTKQKRGGNTGGGNAGPQRSPPRASAPPTPVISSTRSSLSLIEPILSVSHSRDNFSPSPLCTPGLDCTKEEFNRSAVDYILSRKLERYRAIDID